MLTLDIRHPDVEEFITKKQDLTKVTGANVSVQVTDDFMDALSKDEDFLLRFPINTQLVDNIDLDGVPYDELCIIKDNNDKEVAYFKKVKASKLWDKLMYCAWCTAEPGIIFQDRMVQYSPDGIYNKFKPICTNPCGK